MSEESSLSLTDIALLTFAVTLASERADPAPLSACSVSFTARSALSPASARSFLSHPTSASDITNIANTILLMVFSFDIRPGGYEEDGGSAGPVPIGPRKIKGRGFRSAAPLIGL